MKHGGFRMVTKDFLVLMFTFSCVLGAILGDLSASVLRQTARYLPHHTSGNVSKTYPKSARDKFKTVSQWISVFFCISVKM